tara:strand:- start:3063 stop:3455 length:393 start_codon:yes stop_codon:yes gene_type:complete
MMQRIVFFDGICPFCNSWVRYLLKIDKNKQFLFAQLQGKTAYELLPSKFLNVDTIVLLENKNDFYTKSTAIFRIIKVIGGFRKILLIFIFVPRFIRDYIYNLIARNRFLISKPLKHCPLPSADIAGRFLP